MYETAKSRLKKLIGFSLLLFLLTNCDPCENTEIMRITSPNGEKDFVLFERNCGATTDFSLQGSVLRKGEKLPGSEGNAIIMGSENYYNNSNITAFPVWKSDDEIYISCEALPELFKLDEVMGVTVIAEQNLMD